MSHQEKIERLIADLSEQGVSPQTTAPPMFRLLWSLGLKIPPPLYMRFSSLALLGGVPFGLLWGLFMWLLVWRSRAGLEYMVLISLLAGVFFGLAMAAYYRWRFRRLKLPPWENYGSEVSPIK